MKKLFLGFLVVLLALSAVALWMQPARVHNGKIVLSYACVEFWAKRDQVDDPIAIYDGPANRFVAGFIGTPPMNFFEGQLVRRGDALVFENPSAGVTLQVSQARAGRLDAFEGKPIVLGLRPEDIGSATAEAQTAAPRLRAKVNVVEPMGSETFVYLLVDGVQCVSRMEPHKHFHPGNDVDVPVNMAKAHFFDSGTGERISAG